VCPNCLTARTDRYCAHCGQDNRFARLGVLPLLTELVDVLANVDSRAWRTVRELTMRPGSAVRRYVDGQRVRYVNPLRYAILTCALWWLLALWHIDAGDLEKMPAGMRTMLQYGSWSNLAALPVLALPLWLAFLRERFGYVEHLCCLLFVAGHVFLWRAVLAGLGPWLKDWSAVVAQVDAIGFMLFLFVALVSCHWGRARWVVVRSLVAVAAFVVSSGLLMQMLWRWLS